MGINCKKNNGIPRHPVIPPEVRCFRYVFGAQISNLRRWPWTSSPVPPTDRAYRLVSFFGFRFGFTAEVMAKLPFFFCFVPGDAVQQKETQKWSYESYIEL